MDSRNLAAVDFTLPRWHGAPPLTTASPQPARVLYVHNSADIYGASRSLLRLLPQIKARGYEPLVVLPENGPLRERIEALGLGAKVIVDPWLSVIDRAAFKSPVGIAKFFLGFPVSVARLWRIVARERVSLVHTNTGVMPAPALAAKLAGVPHLWHVRDSFEEFRSLWKVYRRYITALSRRVICVSNPIAGQFQGAPNVTVIHNGMPLEEFPSPERAAEMRASFRKQHRIGDALVVGCVGRIKFVRKGQEVLVQAMALLKQRGVAAKCLIVGSTSAGNEDHLTRLLKLIEDLDLKALSVAAELTRLRSTSAPSAQEKSEPPHVGCYESEADVILTGELTDPKPAYAAMDVFVLPSAQPEPFGGVVLEAMAMRRPVIATNIGGSLDQVADAETGFLVPPGDAEALAAKLEVLLRETVQRERMSEAGRERLERIFSIQQMVEKIQEVYQDCAPAAGETIQRA